ncbi:MAG: glutamyl-tRNA reductase [Actinomycetota bacterium]
MTGLTMVGVTHRGAPLPLLERVAISRDKRPGLLARLRVLGCSEAVLLSTCSRVEIYVGNASLGANELVEGLVNLLAGHSGATLDGLRGVVEVRAGQAVVDHLFEVTAGLSSRVLGEVEILAQTRTAFREAAAAGMTGPVLGALFPAAMRSGRQVRAATSLGEYGRSLAHKAVDVGMTSLARCPDPMVLIVGSGHMAHAAVDHLAGSGVQLAVAARDEVYAARLAGSGAVCPMPSLIWGIAAADLLICATSAAQHVVTVDHVSQAMRGRTRPLTVIDMSVPRNVDSAVAHVPGVTLIDLEGLSDAGTADPGVAAALSTGAEMARAAARDFAEGLTAREAGPLIAALRRRVGEIFDHEFAGTRSWGDLDHEALSRMSHAFAGRLAHRTTVMARQAAAAGDIEAMRALCDMFDVPLAEVGLTEASLPRVDPARAGNHAHRIAV